MVAVILLMTVIWLVLIVDTLKTNRTLRYAAARRGQNLDKLLSLLQD